MLSIQATSLKESRAICALMASPAICALMASRANCALRASASLDDVLEELIKDTANLSLALFDAPVDRSCDRPGRFHTEDASGIVVKMSTLWVIYPKTLIQPVPSQEQAHQPAP
jgi:hypothetical protein